MTFADALVARCPGCHSVTDHAAEGGYHRCLRCHGAHDLMSSLA